MTGRGVHHPGTVAQARVLRTPPVETGEGDAEAYVPRIQAQHFNSLVRHFEHIRDRSRRNGNPEMQAQIEGFEDDDVQAVLDNVSRLDPPEELQAPPGWANPDFAK